MKKLDVLTKYSDELKNAYSLNDIDVIFRNKKHRGVFECRPLFFSKYKYVIYISTREPFREFFLDMDNEIIKGWLAHEFGHIVQYRRMNSFELFWTGVKYLLSHSFRKKFELEANHIAYGMGYEDNLRRSIDYYLESKYLSKKFKNNLRKFYVE